ncbi:hypothetical protein Tco_0755675 [Tanacetum coccineum]
MMPKRSGQPSRHDLVLDALGAGVSDEDANHKFLRSLPPAWDSLAMTMRTKKNINTLSIDDLYNNLSVFEQDIQKTSSSSLASDNVAFLSQAKASSSKHKPSQKLTETNADDVIAMTAIKITRNSTRSRQKRPSVDGKCMWHYSYIALQASMMNCNLIGTQEEAALVALKMLVNVNTGHGNVSSGRVYVNTGTQFKSGGSRFNTGHGNVNSGRVHVNTARVNRPVLSNQTSQVNLKSPKKCFSKQSSPVNRPFSRHTAYKSNIYAVKGKMGTAVKTSAEVHKADPSCERSEGPSEDYLRTVQSGIVTLEDSKVFQWGKEAVILLAIPSTGVILRHQKSEVNLSLSNFLKKKPNVQGIGHRWMFDLDYLTDSMNYIPVSVQNQANPAGSKEVIDIDVQTEEDADLMVVSSTSLSEKIATKKTHSPRQPSSTPISKSADDIMTFRKELDALALKHLGPVPTTVPTSTNPVNTGSINLNTAFEEVNTGNTEVISPSADHEEEASYDDEGIISDFNNLPDEVDVPTNPTLRIHNAHPQSQILGDPNTPVQTRSSLKKITEAHALHLKMEHGVEICREDVAVFKLHQIEAISYYWPLPHSWFIVYQMDVYVLFVYGTMMRGLCLTTSWKHGYKRGTLDKSYSLVRNKKDIMLVQVVYQLVCRTRNRHLLSQDKYVAEILKKFDLVHVKLAIYSPGRPSTQRILISMLSRVIFKVTKGQPNLGIMGIPRESHPDLMHSSDSGYGGSILTGKSTTGGCQFFGQ